MSRLQIVGISGKAETGKDYIVANVLRPLGYFQVSLADHLKTLIVGKGLATYDEVFVTKPPHVRKLMQLEGTERGRDVWGQDVWCHTLDAWTRLLHDRNGIDKFVLADVRFPNEVELVRRLGGGTIRIVAPHRAEHSRLNAEARLHPSETALDDYTDFEGFVQNDPEYAITLAPSVRGLLEAWFPDVTPLKVAA